MSTRRRATQTRSLIGIKERYTWIQAATAMQLQLIDSPTSSTWAKSINAPQSTRASQPANQSSPISHYHNERDKGDRSRGAVGRRVVRVADKPMASAGGVVCVAARQRGPRAAGGVEPHPAAVGSGRKRRRTRGGPCPGSAKHRCGGWQSKSGFPRRWRADPRRAVTAEDGGSGGSLGGGAGGRAEEPTDGRWSRKARDRRARTPLDTPPKRGVMMEEGKRSADFRGSSRFPGEAGMMLC